MPRSIDYTAPCCPICCHSLAKNGLFKGKQRWRCTYCKGYSQTDDSTSHNSNVRTFYGWGKRFAVYNESLTTQTNKAQDNCPSHSGFRQSQLSLTYPN